MGRAALSGRFRRRRARRPSEGFRIRRRRRQVEGALRPLARTVEPAAVQGGSAAHDRDAAQRRVRSPGLDVADVRAEAGAWTVPSTMPAPASRRSPAPADSKALAGKVVVVEMWATWCPPCRSTMAWLNHAEAKYGDRLAVIAVAVDSPDADVRSSLPSSKRATTSFRARRRSSRSFGDVAAVPKLFVFDRSGRRIQTFYGAPPDLHREDRFCGRALGSGSINSALLGRGLSFSSVLTLAIARRTPTRGNANFPAAASMMLIWQV